MGGPGVINCLNWTLLNCTLYLKGLHVYHEVRGGFGSNLVVGFQPLLYFENNKCVDLYLRLRFD